MFDLLQFPYLNIAFSVFWSEKLHFYWNFIWLNRQHILYLWNMDFAEMNESKSQSKYYLPVSCLDMFWLNKLLKNKFIENHVLRFCLLVFYVGNCRTHSNINTTIGLVKGNNKRVTKHTQKFFNIHPWSLWLLLCKQLHQDKSPNYTQLYLLIVAAALHRTWGKQWFKESKYFGFFELIRIFIQTG